MECPRCRLENPPTALRCDCGYDFATRQAKASYLASHEQRREHGAQSHASLLPRAGAVLVDVLIFWAVGMAMALALGFLSDPLASVERLRALVDTVWGESAGLLFYALFEASPWQGTPGKRALGLRVERYEGGRISFLRSLARNLAKTLSGLLFPITILQVAFSREHRALHDLLTGTCVIRATASSR